MEDIPEKGAGRPELSVLLPGATKDWEQFDKYCETAHTLEEIAYLFDCSADTIERRVLEAHGVNFAEYFMRKSCGGRISLRRLIRQNAFGHPRRFDKEGREIMPAIKPHAPSALALAKQTEKRGGLGYGERITLDVEDGDGSYEAFLGPRRKKADPDEGE